MQLSKNAHPIASVRENRVWFLFGRLTFKRGENLADSLADSFENGPNFAEWA
jgi:hypothetical protein